MHDKTTRGLLAAGIAANVIFLLLALLDYAFGNSHYMWPIFVAWAFVIVLLAILSFVTSSGRHIQIVRDDATPALARAVASLAQRPAQPSPVLASTPPRAAAVAPLEFKEDAFPFTYNGYTLYSRAVDLKNGGTRTIWFFSKRTPKSGSMARKPAHFHVGVNERTGLPFLKKGGGADGEDLTPAIEHALRPQCSALTEDSKQCRNSARADSKYCASHFGYQPPTEKGLAKRIEGESWSARDKLSNKQSVKGADTRPVVKRAPDTKVSVRKKPAA